jgi:hypothetical protein
MMSSEVDACKEKEETDNICHERKGSERNVLKRIYKLTSPANTMLSTFRTPLSLPHINAY